MTTRVFAVLRTGLLATVLMAACALVDAPAGESAGGQETVLTDFGNLVRPESPNTWLVGPADFSPKPDQTAPVFAVPAATLARAWIDVLEIQPRTRILAVSPDGLQVEAQQTSAVFGFVDRIAVRVLPLAAERCTFVAYSRAQVGYWDLGVNRRRLGAWIRALASKVRPDAASWPGPNASGS
jgi:uncharacterized protein (DUF1499 family)